MRPDIGKPVRPADVIRMPVGKKDLHGLLSDEARHERAKIAETSHRVDEDSLAGALDEVANLPHRVMYAPKALARAFARNQIVHRSSL